MLDAKAQSTKYIPFEQMEPGRNGFTAGRMTAPWYDLPDSGHAHYL